MINEFNVVKIPKKHGGFRYIYIPSDSLKEKLHSLLYIIKNISVHDNFSKSMKYLTFYCLA
jgi:hypothetical protein